MVKYYFIAVILSIFLISGCSKDDNPASPTTKGTITGKITDQGTGNGVSGASITTQPPSSSTISDNNGNYTILTLRPVNIPLRLQRMDFFPAQLRFQ